ncbi:hypothetical protein ACJX0J_021482, partial [Zea mays]
ASDVSNRPEGLALLTRIAEDTDCCDSGPPLPDHSPLEKSLISKILRLRGVLDLPCRSSCDALDQLLLDTLGVLKVAYPKCLSGVSGNHTSSVREGLVHLHQVLVLVQDCYSKIKQLPNSGSEKQTIMESESLDHVGKRVIEMLDQVTPVVKEMFSSMESSSSAQAAAAAAAWPEDLPERRTLPPVLCRTTSHHPSDGDEVAMHTGRCKVEAPAPGHETDEGVCTREEDGQTSSREPLSAPIPTAEFLPLQPTLSSVSPHLLSAPPPSPMPVVGLSMLLQSWEATQDGHATAAAVVPPAGVAQPAEAAPTAHKDTTPVGTSMEVEGSTSSVLLEAGQPEPCVDSPNGSTQAPAQGGNAAVPNVPPPPPPVPAHRGRSQEGPSMDEPGPAVTDTPPRPPCEMQGEPPALPPAAAKVLPSPSPSPSPPPLPAHRGRFQEGASMDEPGQAVTDTPPRPPCEVQGGPPAPPPAAAKVSPAPPPPPGSISAAVRGKKAASKLKRSTQMGSLYRRLRDRVEGSGSTHGDRMRQNRKRPRTVGASKSDAGGQGMADALAEMAKRSTYFRQIEEDAEKYAAVILELKDAIGSFQSKDMSELVRFRQHVERQLVCLTDETQVLARFEGFPSKKLEALRTAAALYSKLDGTASRLQCWKHTAGPVSAQLDRLESYFNK